MGKAPSEKCNIWSVLDHCAMFLMLLVRSFLFQNVKELYVGSIQHLEIFQNDPKINHHKKSKTSDLNRSSLGQIFKPFMYELSCDHC